MVVLAAVHDTGEVSEPITFEYHETDAIIERVWQFRPFRAVIGATSTYRWLHDLLSLEGTILLAHPTRLRTMIQRCAKTDRLDCQLLANFLRINRIPLAYVPPMSYQQLRDVIRYRARLVRSQSHAKIGLYTLLARYSREAPYKVSFGSRGVAWF